MNKEDKKYINRDEIGENIEIYESAGLSTPEAEEAGDFEGDGEIKKKTVKDGKGSAGETLYPFDPDQTDTSTTGTNARKDPNLEKQGAGEADKERDTWQQNISL